MKLSIEGTPEEIKNALQAICGSEEREEIQHQIDAIKTSVIALESSI